MVILITTTAATTSLICVRVGCGCMCVRVWRESGFLGQTGFHVLHLLFALISMPCNMSVYGDCTIIKTVDCYFRSVVVVID